MYGKIESMNLMKTLYTNMVLIQNKRYAKEVLGKELIKQPSFISRVTGMFNKKEKNIDKKEFDNEERWEKKFITYR